jgi:hypothetical protein
MKKIPRETYSRVVGYFRPINQWNKGKKSEFADRKDFSIEKIEENINGHRISNKSDKNTD